ncbi:MAG: DUF47 family protein [Bacteroidales bacterium]|nr:DUF47 family protein [Bacteroidales bacterium]MDD4575500.1 DUF47 family protein [Bacteroidales bacterium]
MKILSPFKRTSYLINGIESFIVKSDDSAKIFKNGVLSYLEDNIENLKLILAEIHRTEAEADKLKRDIEKTLTKHSLIPEYRSDVLGILEKMDDIIDTAKENLLQFEVERPFIPRELHGDIMDLTNMSCACVEEVNKATRMFFKDVSKVKEITKNVRLHEHNADKLALKIKRQVFQEMPGLSLAEKAHIRYFTLHIENISDIAENLSDMVQILAIKRTI